MQYLSFMCTNWHSCLCHANVCCGFQDLMLSTRLYITLQILSFINFVFNVNYQHLSTASGSSWRLRSQMIAESNTKSMKLFNSLCIHTSFISTIRYVLNLKCNITLQILKSFINFVYNVSYQLLSTASGSSWRLRSQMITESNTKSMKLYSSLHP